MRLFIYYDKTNWTGNLDEVMIYTDADALFDQIETDGILSKRAFKETQAFIRDARDEDEVGVGDMAVFVREI